ncbi:MAG: site-specific integrase [Gammaproteobacteria bacterium]|jgi:integrase|nr:site-specific integrase [Gammaproteobacteria bacterium]
MPIVKRGKTWYVRFTAPNGSRIFVSARTSDKQAAQEYHDHLKVEYWRVQQIGDRPRYLWQQAVVRWIAEKAHKSSLKDDKCHLRWLDAHLRDIPLVAITTDRLQVLIQAKFNDGVSPASVNRMLAVVRSILRCAANQWGWIDKPPAVRMLSESKRRIRWLTRQDTECLIKELPPHLAAMAGFALLTGLRESNITGLEWSQVDLERCIAWIHPDQAKSRKAVAVPLNAQAILILYRQIGQHPRWVFTYHGNRVTRANNHAWRKALKRAGIEDFRFHDLRHTWASWHVQAGTPLYALQEMAGWSTVDMVRRYAHLSADHLADYAENLCRPKLVGGAMQDEKSA